MSKYWRYCPYCGSTRVMDYESETEPEMAVAVCRQCKTVFHVVRHLIDSELDIEEMEEVLKELRRKRGE